MELAERVPKIPTHIITGFLGAGKTTVLQQLIGQKPASERWAILVNEFGQLGLDAAVLSNQGVQLSSVAGGCLCCLRSPLFQVSLNRLIREARPQRLWIEPSGLGHPDVLREQLCQPPWASVLQLAPLSCVLDPAALLDPRYREHELFRQQLASAERWIINRMDEASPDALAAVADCLAQQARPVSVIQVAQGQVPLAWIQAMPESEYRSSISERAVLVVKNREEPELELGLWHGQQQAEQWSWSCRFPANSRWLKSASHAGILELFQRYPSLWRAKARLHTEQGWFICQASPRFCNWQPSDAGPDSRLECIGAGTLPDNADWQQACAEIFANK